MKNTLVYFRKWKNNYGSDAYKSYQSNLSDKSLVNICKMVLPTFISLYDPHYFCYPETDGCYEMEPIIWNNRKEWTINFNIAQCSDDFIDQKIKEFQELDARFNQLQLFI